MIFQSDSTIISDSIPKIKTDTSVVAKKHDTIIKITAVSDTLKPIKTPVQHLTSDSVNTLDSTYTTTYKKQQPFTPNTNKVTKKVSTSNKTLEIDSIYNTSDSVYFSANNNFPIKKEYNTKLFNVIADKTIRNAEFITKKNWYPEWGLLILFASLILILFTRLFFNKISTSYFRSIFNYRLSVKLLEDPSSVKKQFFTLLNANFIIMFSFFLYLSIKYYRIGLFETIDLWLPLKTLTLTVIWLLFRYVSIGSTRYIVKEFSRFEEYNYHIFFYFKLIGLILLPLNILILYSSVFSPQTYFFIGFSLFSIAYLITVQRGFMILSQKGVLIYYRILYLCTLEIMPLSFIIKYVLT